MWRLPIAFACVGFAACSPDFTSGIGPFIRSCANLETQQTTVIGGSDVCPSGWVEGSINKCTNTQTGEVELKFMEFRNECPAGYTGGEVHNRCSLDDVTGVCAPI